MNVRAHLSQRWSAFAGLMTIMLLLVGCQGSGSYAAANASATNNPELFTIPQDQMSHIQVLSVQPTTLSRCG